MRFQVEDLKSIDAVAEIFEIFLELRREGLQRYGAIANQSLAGNGPDRARFLDLMVSDDLGCRIFSARSSECVVGIAITQTVMASWNGTKVMNVHDLYVIPSYRRRGVGRGILRCIESEASRLAMSALSLETTLVNIAARRLYLSEKYEGTGLVNGECPILAAGLGDSLVIQMKKRL